MTDRVILVVQDCVGGWRVSPTPKSKAVAKLRDESMELIRVYSYWNIPVGANQGTIYSVQV